MRPLSSGHVHTLSYARSGRMLPPFSGRGASPHRRGDIEAAVGVTTGVSAADRVTTVLAAVRPEPTPRICAVRAMSFRCGPAPAVYWSGGDTPKPQWISWLWPVLLPAASFAN